MSGEAGAPRRDAVVTALLCAYALSVVLVVGVSARLWWQTPLNLIAHEFDFFVGLFAGEPKALAVERVAQGRLLFAVLTGVMGLLYLALVARVASAPNSLTPRFIAGYAGLVSLLFAAGMPYLSPDVFFYIGTGWLESHYGASPYQVAIHSLPGQAQDEMFANVFPGFKHGTSAYGPLFQKLAALIAGLSGGSEKLALLLHKGAHLGLHAAASWLVWRLAPAAWRRLALLSYAANPLIGFSVLTCVHNDHWMNVALLLALLALARRRWLGVGAALGAAFSIKYFPLVYLPLLAVAALVQPERTLRANIADAAKLVASFAAVVAVTYLPYLEATPAFSRAAAYGVMVYRNSIYHFADFMSFFVLPELTGGAVTFLSYKEMGQLLRIGYIGLYAVVLLLYLRRLRADTFGASVEACVVMTLLYFIVVNTTNQEWYLTWLMGFLFVLPQPHARALGWRLSALFLPLVIYTVRPPLPSVQLLANAALYLLVLTLSVLYFRRVATAPRAATPA